MHCNSTQRAFTKELLHSFLALSPHPPALRIVLFAAVTTIDLRGIIDHGGQFKASLGIKRMI